MALPRGQFQHMTAATRRSESVRNLRRRSSRASIWPRARLVNQRIGAALRLGPVAAPGSVDSDLWIHGQGALSTTDEGSAPSPFAERPPRGAGSAATRRLLGAYWM